MGERLFAALVGLQLALACSADRPRDASSDAESHVPPVADVQIEDVAPGVAKPTSGERRAKDIRAHNEAVLARLRAEEEAGQRGEAPSVEAAEEASDRPVVTRESVLANAMKAVVSVEAGGTKGSGFFITPPSS